MSRWLAMVYVSCCVLYAMFSLSGCADKAEMKTGKEPTLALPASPTAGQPAEPNFVIEKEYYVPFEDIQKVFEQTGRGIFLPYEKFIELWNAAEERKRPIPAPPPAGAVVRGGSYKGSIEGDVARFDVTYSVEALKEGWSNVALPLKNVAVEKVELSRTDALFVTTADSYSLYLPSPGTCDVRLVVSTRVAPTPGKKTIHFAIPTTAISRLELTIPEDNVRVDVEPSLVVTQTFAEGGATRVLAFLGNASEVSVNWMPPAGKAADGGAILFAQQWLRVQLLERILKIATDIDFDVQRGEVDTLKVRLPQDTRLISVNGENIRAWNPEGDLLTVQLHAPIEIGKRYRLSLAFERILAETPPSIGIPFPRVEEVLRESGWAVLRYDSDLNVRVRSAQGLSQLDPEEVPDVLRPELGLGFRYLAHPLSIDLSIEKIMPVVRVNTLSVVSLGREEDQWTGWIDYSIAKAGLFRFEFRVPSGWNVDTIGTPGSIEEYHTTDVPDAKRTLVQVSLKAKAIGDFRLPFRLTRDGNATQPKLDLFPIEVLGANQERGILGITAPRDIEIITAERPGMLDADADELFRSGIMGQISSQTSLPRAYQYHKHPASLKLTLEEKKTEIQVLAQHLVEVADGEIRVTHLLDFVVLYAPVEKLRFRAPTSLDETLKIDAKQKTQTNPVAREGGMTTWEVGFQPPLLGAVTLNISHAIDLKGLDPGKPASFNVPIVRADGVRAEQGFVAIRKEGTLEIAPATEAMEVIDAGDLPDKLRRGQIYSAFRYFSGQPSLNLNLTRFEYEALATTVVQLVHMGSALSEGRQLRTQAVLYVQNTERQYLELQLAPQAKVLSLSVAGKTQSPRKRKDGAGTLVQIPRSAGVGGTFAVLITYEEPIGAGDMGSFGAASLESLQVLDNVPVSKVELDLFVPPEYRYMAWGGNLALRDDGGAGLWARFKNLLLPGAAAEPGRGGAVAPGSPGMPSHEGIVIDIPVEGLTHYRFDTLAPAGKLSFFYVGNKLYWFADFVAFLAAIGIAQLVLARCPRARREASLVLLLIAFSFLWFASGPVIEFAVSIVLGCLLVVLLHFASYLQKGWKEWRAARAAPALAGGISPDPFLEDLPLKLPDEPTAPSAPPPSEPPK